ncbi:MAG: 30S ribosomal protein S9 [Patescibacteria group bacterium]|nr:30S ribosomal protein S9 [Patescibacteria group bacterium]
MPKVKKEKRSQKKSKSSDKKKKVAKKPAIKEIKKPEIKEEPTRYLETVGRRKTAVARIRLFTKGEKLFLVNEKPYQDYFPTFTLQQIADASLRKMKCLDKFRISAKVKGGGLHAQAEAVRHGIARALVLFNPDFRKRLRKAGYLTRDARMRERKKFGLKRARRAPQWQKR